MICVGMMNMRPVDFWNLSPREMYLAIRGFKQFNTAEKEQPMDDADFFMMDAEDGISDEDQLENEEDNISEIYCQMISNDTTAQIEELQKEKKRSRGRHHE